MSRGYIRTIADLEREYYLDPQRRDYLQKDAPVITGTTGVYNPIYGMKVWEWLNMEINAWSLIPKAPWNQSGWRVITARGAATVSDGVAENGAIPATIKPTFAAVKTIPKTVAHAFDVSEVQQYLGTVDDSLGDTMAFLREYFAKEHVEHINKMLLKDVSAEAAAASAARTTADKYRVESLDRIVSNDSEEDAFGGTYDDWFDIYDLDRDSATTADAYVDHNSGTDRTFTMSMLDTAIDTVAENSGHEPTVILTGHDTRQRILQEQEVMQRYVEPKKIKVGINGVQTASGIEAGFNVATYRDLPIIVSKDVTKDTISRVYVLNTDLMEIGVAKPTQYFESGMSKGDPFGIDRLGDEGMYRTMAEIKCFNFKAQGKIRDLK